MINEGGLCASFLLVRVRSKSRIGYSSRRGGSRRNVIQSRRELQDAGKGEDVLCVYVFPADNAFGFSRDSAIVGSRIVSLKLP